MSELDLGGLKLCDSGASFPSAPEDWYRDKPRYVGNEQPTSAVWAWAENLPGFQELWIDWERNGWVSVGFSQDVEQRQAEIRERWPNDGVVAVSLDVDLAELRRLEQEVMQTVVDARVAMQSLSVSASQGRVVVRVAVLSEENLAPLRRFAGQPICVEGADPATARTGPQSQSGDGWRLLIIDGTRRRGPELDPARFASTGTGHLGRRLQIATTPAQLRMMWEVVTAANDVAMSPATPMPVVDFAHEIVVFVNEKEGRPSKLIFGLEVDGSTRTVAVDRGVPTGVVRRPVGSTLTWAIAVERSALLAPPFTLIGPPDLKIEVDLRQRGASVDDDATIASAEDQEQSQLPAHLSAFPHVIESGFPSEFALPIDAVSRLGPLNHYFWLPVDEAVAGGDVPDDWLAVASDGRIPVVLSLQADDSGEPSLTVTANERSERYLIA